MDTESSPELYLLTIKKISQILSKFFFHTYRDSLVLQLFIPFESFVCVCLLFAVGGKSCHCLEGESVCFHPSPCLQNLPSQNANSMFAPVQMAGIAPKERIASKQNLCLHT